MYCCRKTHRHTMSYRLTEAYRCAANIVKWTVSTPQGRPCYSSRPLSLFALNLHQPTEAKSRSSAQAHPSPPTMPPSALRPITTMIDTSYPPNFGLQMVLVGGLGCLLVALYLGIAAIVAHRRRRRALRDKAKACSPTTDDLEHQDCGFGDIKDSSPSLPFPPAAALSRTWSGSTCAPGSPALGMWSPDVSPSALGFAPSSRPRDSVLCRTIGKLPFSDMHKGKNSSRRVADVEAGISFQGLALTGGFDAQSRLLNPIVPKIVIQSCDDDPAPDSPASIYSTDSSTSSTSSSVLDTPPPMTPTLASPISFYFPTSPSFSTHDYLQVPPPSCHAPREEDKPVTRNVSNVSGQTFMLAAPPTARFSKVGKSLMERRMAAGAQATKAAGSQPQPQPGAQPSRLQVVRGCGVGPRVVRNLTLDPVHRVEGGVAGLGFGLALQPKPNFQARLADTVAVPQPTVQEGRRGFSHANNESRDPDLASAFQHPPTTNVVTATSVATQDDLHAHHVDDVTVRPERLARPLASKA
ncbi:hypothetical protein C8Q79DRAFT_968255 [Trametes meyenii]|nr:hypothetical protein C8Q79DRAFT_968255 [Trametes meyenii]